MTPENKADYLHDISRMEQVGVLLREKLYSSELTRHEFTVKFAEEIGCKPITTKTLISTYVSGNAVVGYSKHTTNGNSERHLERLAIFCSYLNLKSDDETIEIIKKVNPKFQYPPETLEGKLY